jgi:thiol-disulfide isomerase/thioredoxin
MKRGKLLPVLLAAGLLAAGGSAFAVGVGQPAPDFTLPGAKGQVKLGALKGKVVYVDFWASWCGPCKQSFPWLNDMQAKYGAQGFTVIGVNVDAKRGDADKFLAQVPANFTLAFDAAGTTPGLYEAKGMPTSYLIGRDGKVVSMHVGFRTDEKDALEGKIRQALGVKQ